MSLSWRMVVAFAVAVFAMLPWSGAAGDKDDKKEKVRIITVDGVELNAHFYRCTDLKAKDPPTILMLHALGEKSTTKNWVALAQALQTKAAVLTFDFRGHGGSTEIEPASFWKIPFNVSHIKNSNLAIQSNKLHVEAKEYKPYYHQALCNDIAACKSYLDRKNDLRGSCNTSTFVLLGAESGATLGAIWLNSEWHRHRVTVNPVTLLSTADVKAEGRHVVACVWLSMATNLNAREQTGARLVSLSTLDIPLKQAATPMVFLYSDEDDKGKGVAKSAIKFIAPKDAKARYGYTAAPEFAGGKLRGSEMLVKSTGVDRWIHTYLFGDAKGDNEGVLSAKGHEWTEHEFKKTQFIWRQPGTPAGANIGSTQAHYINEPNLVFNDYGKFIK